LGGQRIACRGAAANDKMSAGDFVAHVLSLNPADVRVILTCLTPVETKDTGLVRTAIHCAK
jgi:hypothetical protein